MIHARQDYTERVQDSANIIPEDEPVFLLRGQDKHASATLRFWAHLVADEGDVELADYVRKWADKMEEWGEKKQPDCNKELFTI